MNVSFVFPNIVATSHIDINCEPIQKWCYELQKKSFGRKASNVGGWQSESLTEIYPIFNFAKIFFDVKSLFEQLKISHLNPFLSNYWININYKNNFNHAHFHPGSFLSGIFYVKVPNNSGNIIFKNPNAYLQQSFYEYWHILDKELLENEVFASYKTINPQKNLLILFPSWLEHYVEPNNNDEERISIAFNIGVKK